MNRLATFIVLGLMLPAAQAGTPFDETRPLQPDARVALDNLKGRIEVTTWERAEIRIAGQRGEGTEALRIEGDAADLKVKIEYPERRGWFGNWGSGGGESDLRVTVPVGIRLEVDTVAASVDVRGVAGAALSVESVSGDVRIDSGAAELEVETVSGDARVRARSADVSIETVSGDVSLEGELAGRVQLQAVSGRLRLDSRSAMRQIEAGAVSGDIELRAALQPGGRLQAESLSGDLTVVLPAATSARVSAASFTGSIHAPQGKVDRAEHGPGSSLETTLGDGDGRIELETFSGDLVLRQE